VDVTPGSLLLQLVLQALLQVLLLQVQLVVPLLVVALVLLGVLPGGHCLPHHPLVPWRHSCSARSTETGVWGGGKENGQWAGQCLARVR